MTFVLRSRANSDIDSTRYRDWIHQVFPSYLMTHDSSTMRAQSRYMGTCLLTIEYSSSKVMFYQVTEVEFDNNSSSSEEEHPSPTLPPKKRKRQRVTRSQIIFCLEHDQQEMDTTRHYFLFPQEAIVESINTTPLFEVLISYYVPSIPNVEFKQSRRRLTDPGIPLINNQVIHVRLSCVSNELYIALKQTVSDFENMYRKMMELRKLHSQHLTIMNTEVTNKLVIKNEVNEWTSEEDEEMKTEEDDDDEFVLLSSPNISKSNNSSRSTSSTPSSTKQCLYCGSKSTPMWRRGPQGAGTLCNACGVKWKHGKILCEHNPTDHKVEKKKRKYTNKKTTKKKTSVIEDDLNKLTVQETLSSVEEAAALLTLLKQS